jgi:ribosome-associated translation inhibitor RaiA
MVANIRTTLRHIRSFDELSQLIEREARKLRETFQQITSCKVVIDRSHQHREDGDHFRVQVVVSTFGKQLIASSEAEEGYPDILAAVSEAFDIMGNSIRRLSPAHELPFDRPHPSYNSRHL